MCDPIVSVLAITYNQAQYVEDMLRGFLRQKTDFPVEYIIHDDASSDGTQEILKEYEERFPEIFQVIYQTENQWSKGVKITHDILLPRAKGKYIAFCEGDDFWIDHHKLQRQKEFLDTHPDYVCVSHNALIWSCDINYLRAQNTYDTSRELEACDIIDRRFPNIATASKMHRKEVLELEPLFLECGEVGDMPTDFYAFTKGKFYYMDEIMSVYRYESEGSWSQRVNSDIKKLISWRAITLDFLDKYNKYTNGKYEFYVQIYMTRSVQNIVEKLIIEEIERKQFCLWVKQVREENGHKYDKRLDEIVRVVDMMVYGYEPVFLKQLEDLAGTKKYIYGAGKYGNIIAEFMQKNHVDFEGFVVADTSDNPPELFGKKIYSLEDYSSFSDKGKLIVALGSAYWAEVLQLFGEHGIDNYIYPILVRVTPINEGIE